MNAIIDGVAARWNVPVVDICDRFLGREPFLIHGYRTGILSDYRLFGENPIHPNGEGHRIIAEAVWEKIDPIKREPRAGNRHGHGRFLQEQPVVAPQSRQT